MTNVCVRCVRWCVETGEEGRVQGVFASNVEWNGLGKGLWSRAMEVAVV